MPHTKPATPLLARHFQCAIRLRGHESNWDHLEEGPGPGGTSHKPDKQTQFHAHCPIRPCTLPNTYAAQQTAPTWKKDMNLAELFSSALLSLNPAFFTSLAACSAAESSRVLLGGEAAALRPVFILSLAACKMASAVRHWYWQCCCAGLLGAGGVTAHSPHKPLRQFQAPLARRTSASLSFRSFSASFSACSMAQAMHGEVH